MNPALQARVAWLIREQEEVIALLRQELAKEECLATAVELRLGRPAVDGDLISDQDWEAAAALKRLLDNA